MRKKSLTRRLIVAVVVAQLVLTCVLVLLSTYVTRWQLRSSFDEELHGRALAVAALVRYSEDEPPHLMFDNTQLPPPIDIRHPDQYEIVAPGERIIARSSGWVQSFSDPPVKGLFQSFEVGGRRYRKIELAQIPVLDQEEPGKATSDRITVSYVASSDKIRERVELAALFTVLGSVVLLMITTAITTWVVRRGLSPVGGLAKSAGLVTAQDWELKAPEEARLTVELSPLTEAMDRMLAKLQQAFTTEREFVTNAAHELKTPIAVVKSTLQFALQRPRTAEEYHQQLQEALDDMERLESLAHSLLRLARAEQMRTVTRCNLPIVDLAATCEQMAEHWRPIAEEKRVRIRLLFQANAEIRGDADDLELIWSNLIDNAIRYSPTGSQILVRLSRDNGKACVDVHDEGPGIAADELENIFRRFHRGDVSRSRETGGYGLGLAIAKAMTEVYGGIIGVKSCTGEGTTFSVCLPIDQ